MVLSVIDRICQFCEYNFFLGEKPDESKLRFDLIKSKVQNAKNNSFQDRKKRSRLVTLNESNKLLQDVKHSKITYEEALKRMTYISNDIKMFKKWILLLKTRLEC